MIIKPDSQPAPDVSTNDERVADLDHRLDIRAATRIMSGLYRAGDDDDDDDLRLLGAGNVDQARPVTLAASARREELRLDVDGSYPQRVASGVVVLGLQRLYWIASLAPAGNNRWTGTIFYKRRPCHSLPVHDRAHTGLPRFGSERYHCEACEFTAPGGLKRIRRFHFRSRFFHEVDFEFDSAAGEATTTQVATCAHPNRPPALPCEQLTIKKVFQPRRIRRHAITRRNRPDRGGRCGRPLERRRDARCHAGVLVALHRHGPVGDVGVLRLAARAGHRPRRDHVRRHRPQPPPGHRDLQRRVHLRAARRRSQPGRMGAADDLLDRLPRDGSRVQPRAFLAEVRSGTPWMPGLADEPEARSFMNYPLQRNGGAGRVLRQLRVSASATASCCSCGTRLSGSCRWATPTGSTITASRRPESSPQPALQLELGVNRESGVFEFLEPVTLELKLTNISTEPQIVDANILSSLDAMTVIIKPQGKPAREFRPFGRYCYLPQKIVLRPAESIYSPLAVSAGLNGWDLAEPGRYMVQVALRSG